MKLLGKVLNKKCPQGASKEYETPAQIRMSKVYQIVNSLSNHKTLISKKAFVNPQRLSADRESAIQYNFSIKAFSKGANYAN